MKDFIKGQLKKHIFEAENEKIDTSKIKIKRQVVNNLLVFTPFYGAERMGAFRLKPFGDDYKVFGVVLYDKFKGQGLGKGMYRYIIKTLAKEGKKLFSDDKQSPEAQNVWNSLVRNGFASTTDTGYVSI